MKPKIIEKDFVTLEKGYRFFIDAQGDVSKRNKVELKKVKRAGIRLNTDYFIDLDGNLCVLEFDRKYFDMSLGDLTYYMKEDEFVLEWFDTKKIDELLNSLKQVFEPLGWVVTKNKFIHFKYRGDLYEAV